MNQEYQIAKKLAVELGHPYIGTEHMVYGCLKTDKELANTIGVSAIDYKEEIIDLVGTAGSPKPPVGPTPFLQNLLDMKDITPKKFLTHLLEAKEGAGYRILNMLCDMEVLEEYVVETALPRQLEKCDCIINLNAKVAKNNIQVFGMDEYCDELINNLFRVRKPSVMLIGPAGCGKTALVEKLAFRINQGQVPEFMKDKILVELVVSDSVAGTKYRGEFEEKMKRILQTIIQHPNIILFIDEIHTIMTAGGAEGAIAMSNILKPYLARGDLSLIGATTETEYRIIEKDKAMKRRFTNIEMKSPSAEELRNILKGWSFKFESHYKVSIEDSLIRQIIRDCRKNKAQNSPDRELDALEKWCLENCNWRSVEWEMETHGV